MRQSLINMEMYAEKREIKSASAALSTRGREKITLKIPWSQRTRCKDISQRKSPDLNSLQHKYMEGNAVRHQEKKKPHQRTCSHNQEIGFITLFPRQCVSLLFLVPIWLRNKRTSRGGGGVMGGGWFFLLHRFWRKHLGRGSVDQTMSLPLSVRGFTKPRLSFPFFSSLFFFFYIFYNKVFLSYGGWSGGVVCVGKAGSGNMSADEVETHIEAQCWVV